MKTLLAILLVSINAISHAQVGIGTTTPNSTLDVRGSLALSYRAFTTSTSAASTDHKMMFTGTLASTLTLPDATTCMGREYVIKNISTAVPAAFLTLTTVSSQTIDGGASILLDDMNETVIIVSNGTNWNLLTSALGKTRSNYILVKSAADLPAPVGGVITLVAGTTYAINGTIMLTSMINLNGCYMIGVDANNDKLIYTPATGEMFTGTKGGTIKMLTMAAVTTGSKLFNLNLGATENFIFRDNIVANCKDVGIVKGGYIVFFSVTNYSANVNGITYENNTNLFLDNTAWFPTNTNTFEKFVGTFEIIEKLGGFSQPMGTAVGIDVTGVTTINQVANFKNTALIGTGIRVNGAFSNKWEVEVPGVNTEKDDVAVGSFYLTTIINTPIAVVNNTYKVLGTTTATNLFRVSAPVSNRLTYSGTKMKRFQVIAALSTVSNGDGTLKNFTFYIAKNGVILPESRQSTVLLNNNLNPTGVTLSCLVPLSTNDYVEVFVANNSDATDIIVRSLNLTIR